ncbi:hypothetical protein [Blastomonas sp.]
MMQVDNWKESMKLPVTVLSVFLGGGKTMRLFAVDIIGKYKSLVE